MKRRMMLLILIIGAFFASSYSQSSYKQTNTLLETIGTLSAQSAFMSYTSIGALSDGYIYGAYTDETTITLSAVYMSFATTTKDQLYLLISSGTLSDDDLKFVSELIECFNMIIAQTEAFGNYVSSKDDSYAVIYENNRQKAWSKISNILGIE
ncbi:MAG: hypothetical protein JXR69_03315 [Candidatus Delongbacteria bacterium]|nr:hypothetical protein [Candidatus Delongbacteria bacterium]